MAPVPSSIEKWYRSRCDGDWEHHWDASIETLDNPGWRIQLDLRETKAERFRQRRRRAGDDSAAERRWRHRSRSWRYRFDSR